MPSTVAQRTGIAPVHGADIRYAITGSGPVVVFVHAGIADRRMWDDQVAAFAPYFQVLHYDMRGFGETSMVAGSYAPSDDLHGLLQFLGIAQAALVGCSKGGTAIIDFALAHPEMTTALVPVCATPSGHQFAGEPPPIWAEIMAADTAGDLDRVNELETQLWVVGLRRTPDQVPAAIRDKVAMMNRIALATPEGLGQEQQPEQPAIGRLAEIKMPTLIVVGELDMPSVVAAAEHMAHAIPGAQKLVMAGTAHLPNLEQPDLFNRTVLAFLQSH